MSLSKHIKELNRKIIHNTPEFLGQSSQYRLDKVMHNYSTDFFQAYTLIQTNSSQNISQSFCLSPKQLQVVDFSRFIAFYNLEYIVNSLNIIDYGVSKLNGKEIFGIVLPYIPPERLISNNLNLFNDKQDVILQYVIMPILETLIQLHSASLTHGSINQENIWLNFNQENEIRSVTLSNTSLELPGYSQIPMYEPINRMVAHRAGKVSSKSADCYAVGVLLASLISGKSIGRTGYEAMVKSKAKYGSYRTIINTYFNSADRLDDIQKTVLYFLLHDDEKKRWSAFEALKFLKRRHRNITCANALKLMNEDIESNISILEKPLTFSGEVCHSMTEAAVSSIRNYDEIKIKVKNGLLVKELLANNSIKPDFITKVSALRSLDGFVDSAEVSKDDIFLTTFIILLDNSMPIKLKEISVEANAVWQMLKYTSNKTFSSTVNLLSKIASSNIIFKIHHMISRICSTEIQTLNLSKLQIIQGLSSDVFRSFIPTYVEPNSVYILDEKICFSLDDLLDILNSFNQDTLLEMSEDEKLLGHVLAKVARNSNFSMTKNSILIQETDRFAMFFTILSHAHEINKKSLKNLSKNLYNKLSSNYLHKIKYLKLRNKINEKLKLAADVGDISKMYKILHSRDIERKNGKYLKIINRINTLQDKLNSVNDEQIMVAQARQQTIRLAGAFFIGILLMILYQIS